MRICHADVSCIRPSRGRQAIYHAHYIQKDNVHTHSALVALAIVFRRLNWSPGPALIERDARRSPHLLLVTAVHVVHVGNVSAR